MSSTLLGNRVSEAEVVAVPDVPFTKSHHPVHHRDAIRVVKNSIEAVGLEIVNAEYVLGQKGMQMFSVYDLYSSNGELCWSVGLANSLNKSLSFSILAGNKIFICSNLSFNGDYISVRKHTSGMDIDLLAALAYQTMQTMIPRLQAFQNWHEGLRNYPLSDIDSKILLVEILTNSVVPASKFHQFYDLYGKVYDNSLYGMHESITHLLKGSNLLTQPKKNKALNQVIDNYIYALDSAGTSSLGDFYQQRNLMHI